MLGGAGAGLALLAGIGAALHLTHGIRSRFSDDVNRFADSVQDRNRQRARTNDLPLSRLKDGLPRLGIRDASTPPVLAIIGDSHADAMMPAIDDYLKQRDIPAIGVSWSATAPLLSEGNTPARLRRLRAAFAMVQRHSSVRDVVLIGRWNRYVHLLNKQSLEETKKSLGHPTRRVWILHQVPELEFDVPRALALSSHWGLDAPVGASHEEYLASRVEYEALFAKHFGERVLDAWDLISDGERTLLASEGCATYYDDDHLSVTGAKRVVKVLDRVIKCQEGVASDDEM